MLQNFVTALSREQMRNVKGGYIDELGDGSGSCNFTSNDASCTCPGSTCKCQSGIGLPSGTLPGCITTWSDGSCNLQPSSDCHG
jgi:hypothetical protein